MAAPVDDVSLLVAFLRRLTEDALRGRLRASNVGVTPRGPEMVHGPRVAEWSCGPLMLCGRRRLRFVERTPRGAGFGGEEHGVFRLQMAAVFDDDHLSLKMTMLGGAAGGATVTGYCGW